MATRETSTGDNRRAPDAPAGFEIARREILLDRVALSHRQHLESRGRRPTGAEGPSAELAGRGG